MLNTSIENVQGRTNPLDIFGLALVEGDLELRGERIDRASPDVFRYHPQRRPGAAPGGKLAV